MRNKHRRGCRVKSSLVAFNCSGFVWTARLIRRMCEYSYKRSLVIPLSLAAASHRDMSWYKSGVFFRVTDLFAALIKAEAVIS